MTLEDWPEPTPCAEEGVVGNGAQQQALGFVSVQWGVLTWGLSARLRRRPRGGVGGLRGGGLALGGLLGIPHTLPQAQWLKQQSFISSDFWKLKV